MLDHVHMLIAIPPKYSVSQVTGFIKMSSVIPDRMRLRHRKDRHIRRRGLRLLGEGNGARLYFIE